MRGIRRNSRHASHGSFRGTKTRRTRLSARENEWLALPSPQEETHDKDVRCLPDDRQHASDETGQVVVPRASANARAKGCASEKSERARHGHVVCPKVNRSVRVMSISRARSWPLLDPCAKQERENVRLEKVEQKQKATGETEKKNCHPHNSSPQVQARRLLSRHYYPEGGWGWVVTVVSTLVHLLGPGLQLSIPATLALPATVKFYHHPLHTAGELAKCVFAEVNIVKLAILFGDFGVDGI